MPKLSVIMPFYNLEGYLERTIKSILAQSFADFELIVVNDGSTDGSLKICEKLAEKDSRIIIKNQINSGVSAARNLGLVNATGEYIGFVDGDDIIEPDMYELLINAISENSCDIAMCSTVIENVYKETRNCTNKWTVYSEPLQLYNVGKNNMFSVCNKIFRASILSKLFFQNGLHYGEDGLFLAEAMIASSRVVVCDAIKYHYMQRDDSSSRQKGDIKLWSDYILSRKQIYEMFVQKMAPSDVIDYGFREYGIAIISLLRFTVRDRNCDEYESAKRKYREDLMIFLSTAELSIGKKLEYYSFVVSYKVASLFHFYLKRFLEKDFFKSLVYKSK